MPGRSNLSSLELIALSESSQPRTLDQARELLLEYGQFLASQRAIAGFCLGSLELEASALPHSYLRRAGGALVAYLAGEAVGFVAWRGLSDPRLAHAWELKRLWIRPLARNAGIGGVLVQAVQDQARAAGKSVLLLDTVPEAMPAAYALYRKMGFTERPSYSGPALAGVVYMIKSLE